jgi:hypothetical protein
MKQIHPNTCLSQVPIPNNYTYDTVFYPSSVKNCPTSTIYTSCHFSQFSLHLSVLSIHDTSLVQTAATSQMDTHTIIFRLIPPLYSCFCRPFPSNKQWEQIKQMQQHYCLAEGLSISGSVISSNILNTSHSTAKQSLLSSSTAPQAAFFLAQLGSHLSSRGSLTKPPGSSDLSSHWQTLTQMLGPRPIGSNK